MPEATVLYSVTAAVLAGLVVWVGTVLATAKTAWARPAPPQPELPPDAPLILDAPAAEPAAAPPAPEAASATAGETKPEGD